LAPLPAVLSTGLCIEHDVRGQTEACRAAAPSAKRSGLRTNASNELDLDVAAGQTVCLVTTEGSAHVAWHAQQTGPSL